MADNLPACRHDKAIDDAFEHGDYPIAQMFLDRGWPKWSYTELNFEITERGTRVVSLPILKMGDGSTVWAHLAIGVINEVLIYGVTAIGMNSELLASYHHFPEEVRLAMQLCPTMEQIIDMFNNKVIPAIRR